MDFTRKYPVDSAVCQHPPESFQMAKGSWDFHETLRCMQCGFSIDEAVKIPTDAATGDTSWVDRWEAIMKARAAAAERREEQKRADERRQRDEEKKLLAARRQELIEQSKLIGGANAGKAA